MDIRPTDMPRDAEGKLAPRGWPARRPRKGDERKTFLRQNNASKRRRIDSLADHMSHDHWRPDDA